MASSDSGSSAEFCRILEVSGCKWICYCRPKSSGGSVIGVTNGVDVWQQDLPNSQSPASSPAADFTKLKMEDIKLSVSGDAASLTLGKSKQLYALRKVGSTDRSSELSAAFFAVAEKCQKSDVRLADAERTIESLKQAAANSPTSIFDMTMESKKKKTQPKMQPKQAGMSIVNPGSRKRVQAKGVEFS